MQLLHPAGAASDQVGESVAIDGDTVIVGVPLDDIGANSDQGSAQVYRWTGTGWNLEATLTASDGGPGDQFGASVSISGDTAIVGANLCDVGGSVNQGAAYVFVRSGTAWIQQARLTAADGAAGDQFGVSVAMSSGTAVIGAYADDRSANTNQGSAYVFVQSGTAWIEQAQLIAPNGATGDLFGFSVALSEDTAIVGAFQHNVGSAVDQGAAYVFVRSGSVWTLEAQLSAAGGAAGDAFGVSVAIFEHTAIVAAYTDDVGAAVDQGSAYVFVRSGTTWTEQAQLIGAGGAAGDNFGIGVAVAGDTALIGSYAQDVAGNPNQGAAYVFLRSGAVWTQQSQLTAADGAATDFYGSAVALGTDGDTAVIGAYLDSVGGSGDQGSAWVWSRVGSTWIGSDQRLVLAADATGDMHGHSVAIEGDTAVIGAPGASMNRGRANVYRHSGGVWRHEATLSAPDGQSNDGFGGAVGISDNTIVVGAPGDDSSAGSAYVFTRSGTTWSFQSKLTASGREAGDQHGFSVAIDGDVVLAGAFAEDGPSFPDEGAVYVYRRSGVTWQQEARLTGPSPCCLGGDGFGYSVALEGTTALVGIPFIDQNLGSSDLGAVRVFTVSGTTWSSQDSIVAADRSAFDRFGVAVSLRGDTAIIGAEGDNVASVLGAGSAYVFSRNGPGWTQAAKLTAPDGAAFDGFGCSVAMSAQTALVGARFSDPGSNSNRGSAYVFVRSGNLWVSQPRLTALDGAAGDLFGGAVAIDDGKAVVGARAATVSGIASEGAAYTYELVVEDLPVAHNLTHNTAFGGPSCLNASISAAAQSSVEITATSAAYRLAPSINSGSSPMTALLSSGPIRRAFGSGFNLPQETAPAPGRVIEIFGGLGSFGLRSIGDVRMGPGSTLRAELTLVGDFDCAINEPSRFSDNLGGLPRLSFDAPGTVEQVLEAMSSDIGPVFGGLQPTAAGRFPLRTLDVGGSGMINMNTVRIVDRRDNDRRGQMAREAVYADTVRLGFGSRLITGNCKVYYRTLVNLNNGGTVDVPANLVQVGCGTEGCASATPLPLDGTIVEGSNVFGVCGVLPGAHESFVVGQQAWYTFAGTGADVTVTTCHSGTLLNTLIHVYCLPGGCSGPLNRVAGADDAGSACATNPLASTVRFPTLAGTVYAVVVTLRDASNVDTTGSFMISAVQSPSSGSAACTPNCDLDGEPFNIVELESGCTGASSSSTCPFLNTGVYPGPGRIGKGSVWTAPDGTQRDFDPWLLTGVNGLTLNLCMRSENPIMVQALVGGCPNPMVLATAIIPPCADLSEVQQTVSFPATGQCFLVVTTPGFVGSPCSLGLDEYRFRLAEPCTAPSLSGITPTTQTACIGSSVSLTVELTGGSGPPTLQWSRDAVPIPGANSAVLVLDPVGVSDAGTYSCTASNSCGVAISQEATLSLQCAADFNCSGAVSVQDIFDFLAAYFAGCTVRGAPPCFRSADFNGSGVQSVQDIFDFLAAYFSGC